MPKLNTTIDKIENKDNKIKDARTPDVNWTDEQYPSAKTLYNMVNLVQSYMVGTINDSMDTIAHPVGSILITSTKSNPRDSLGGEWELVDKALKTAYYDVALDEETFWTNTNATLKQYSNVLVMDHMVSFRLNISLNTQITDSDVTLGQLNLPDLGISELSHAIFGNIAISDDGNGVLAYKISQDGTVVSQEALHLDDTHMIDSNKSFYINLVHPVRHTNMLDSYCDKFYWKRVS